MKKEKSEKPTFEISILAKKDKIYLKKSMIAPREANFFLDTTRRSVREIFKLF